MLCKASRDPQNARAVNIGSWSAVSDLLKSARSARNRHLEELAEFAEGGKTPDSCALYENSSHKLGLDAAGARIAAMATALQYQRMEADLRKSVNCRPAGDTDPRREKTRRILPPEEERDDRETSREGDILCSLPVTEKTPFPKITKLSERPCVPFLRDGFLCKRGPKACKWNHISIDKLSPETQKEWIAFVKKTPSISFNPKRVKSAAMSLCNMRAAAALANLPVAATPPAAPGP